MESEDDVYRDIERFLIRIKSSAELILNFDFFEACQDPSNGVIFRRIAGKILAQKTRSQNFNFLEECQAASFHNHTKQHIFFLDEVPELSIEQNFGCFVVDTTNIRRAEVLFQVKEIRVNQKYRNWNFLSLIKHPCNALIITDNYIFFNDRSHENMISILKNIMPNTLKENFEFHLTIIGAHQDPEQRYQVEKEKDRLQKFLSEEFKYSINLTIIQKYHHDRYIFTNYYKITSPRGYSLFRNNRISENLETTLDCKSIAYFSGDYSAETVMLEELVKCRTLKNDSNLLTSDYAGNKINRLLT
ncbi:hypothetical protein Dfri01_05900 [Dyadobacter frigoris]|uniref:Uncharacterized protein n=2 Tax=Dyadobacter frigoris TaxID=2576211 RepID=A0A4U6DB29_9BACT|nr:hypothetical protein [Dyadobacter frigoris]TKT93661.1 hypothetical protein FDK13_00155 [Dyadobacter frigoris]GLU51129.1 hypothetical protein Dfri01_05900 [Dyadobacter frigoris]